MPRAQAPRLASGRSKYQERYDREKASGTYACQEFLCDFHGPSTARLGQHNRLSSRTDRWSCQTCHGWWCSSRSATHHRCEPPGHPPHNGPATPVTTRVNVQNHIQTLPQATINAIQVQYPNLFPPVLPANPPQPLSYPGNGAYSVWNSQQQIQQPTAAAVPPAAALNHLPTGQLPLPQFAPPSAAQQAATQAPTYITSAPTSNATYQPTTTTAALMTRASYTQVSSSQPQHQSTAQNMSFQTTTAGMYGQSQVTSTMHFGGSAHTHSDGTDDHYLTPDPTPDPYAWQSDPDHFMNDPDYLATQGEWDDQAFEDYLS